MKRTRQINEPELQDEPGAGLVDRTALSELYPTAKTAAQLHDAEEARAASRYVQRQLRYPSIRFGLLGGGIVVLGTYFLQHVKGVLLSGSFGVIFMVFAVWLVLFSLLWAWGVRVERVFYQRGTSATGALVSCTVVPLILALLVKVGVFAAESPLLPLLLGGIGALCISLCLRLTLGSTDRP